MDIKNIEELLYNEKADIKKEIKEFQKLFVQIKKKGWIEGVSGGKGNCGLTFENQLNIDKNELEFPDYRGIEIKTKSFNSNEDITLFTYTPEGHHYHEVERLKEYYGYPHSSRGQYNVLNNFVVANFSNKIGKEFYFKLYVNRKKEIITLKIYDLKGHKIEEEVYWEFSTIKEKLFRKMHYLALVKYIRKNIKGKDFFKYYGVKFYVLKDFNTFIRLIEKGIIRINFRIGVFLTGKRTGQIHDHGTSFSISEENLIKLYDNYEF